MIPATRKWEKMLKSREKAREEKFVLFSSPPDLGHVAEGHSCFCLHSCHHTSSCLYILFRLNTFLLHYHDDTNCLQVVVSSHLYARKVYENSTNININKLCQSYHILIEDDVFEKAFFTVTRF